MLDFIPPWGLYVGFCAIVATLLVVETYLRARPAVAGALIATTGTAIAVWFFANDLPWPALVAGGVFGWIFTAAMVTTYYAGAPDRPTDRNPTP